MTKSVSCDATRLFSSTFNLLLAILNKNKEEEISECNINEFSCIFNSLVSLYLGLLKNSPKHMLRVLVDIDLSILNKVSYVYVYVYTFMCICLCMYMCMYVYVYMYSGLCYFL